MAYKPLHCGHNPHPHRKHPLLSREYIEQKGEFYALTLSFAVHLRLPAADVVKDSIDLTNVAQNQRTLRSLTSISLLYASSPVESHLTFNQELTGKSVGADGHPYSQAPRPVSMAIGRETNRKNNKPNMILPRTIDRHGGFVRTMGYLRREYIK